MAPKSKKKGSGRRSKTPGQTSAIPSDSPTTTTTTPQPVQETQQEFISLTLEYLPGPSTPLTASTLWPMKDVFTNLYAPALACAMTALQTGKKDDPTNESEMVIAALFGSQIDDMESTLKSLRWLVEIMKGNTQEKVAMEAYFKMEGLRSAIKLTEVLLAERKKRHGSGGSCGPSKGGGGSGEGDGEGGGHGVTA